MLFWETPAVHGQTRGMTREARHIRISASDRLLTTYQASYFENEDAEQVDSLDVEVLVSLPPHRL